MARNPFDDATNRRLLENRARYYPNMIPIYDVGGDPAHLSTSELYAILRHRVSYPYFGGNAEYHEHRRRIRREIRKRRGAARWRRWACKRLSDDELHSLAIISNPHLTNKYKIRLLRRGPR